MVSPRDTDEEPGALDRLALGFSMKDAGALVDLDGNDGRSSQEPISLPGDAASRVATELDARFGAEVPPRESAGSSAVREPAARGGGSLEGSARFTGPAPLPDLELDLEAAGLRAGATLGRPGRGSPARAPATQDRAAGSSGGLSASSSTTRGSRTDLSRQAIRPSPPPRMLAARPLLARDRAAAWIAGAALGLLVGAVLAWNGGRRAEREEVAPLEQKLADAIDRPLMARAGAVAAPASVVADLERLYDELRLRFLLTWFGTALPVGFMLGALRRPKWLGG